VSIPGLSLEGQVAIVTGARRGIGKATALVLAEAGANVAICDLVADSGELDAVAEAIKKMGRRVLACKTDAKSKSDISSFVERVVDELGTIDILVNNAGIGAGTGPPEPDKWDEQQEHREERMTWLNDNPRIGMFQEEDWDAVLGTNLKSVLLFTQAVSDFMVKKRKGAVVNVASVVAFARGPSNLSAYNISKRGIVNLTRGLAADLGRFGIRVNAIAPGGIETEMMRYIWGVPERLEMMESKMLLGNKLLKPEACAHLILFLVSDLAAYITGQTIVIDGGLTVSTGM
jgi:NAD(P)-dependent dehydrogenase (short-subunit alcohol dehydrogenase family)